MCFSGLTAMITMITALRSVYYNSDGEMVESYDDWSGYDCGDGYIELYDDYCSDYYCFGFFDLYRITMWV